MGPLVTFSRRCSFSQSSTKVFGKACSFYGAERSLIHTHHVPTQQEGSYQMICEPVSPPRGRHGVDVDKVIPSGGVCSRE